MLMSYSRQPGRWCLTADPFKDPHAEKFDHLTYDEVLDRKLGVMDLTAICLCRDHKMPLRVFNMNKPGALLNVVVWRRRRNPDRGGCTMINDIKKDAQERMSKSLEALGRNLASIRTGSCPSEQFSTASGPPAWVATCR